MLLTAEGAGELGTDMTMALDGFTAFEHSLPVELQKDVVQLLAKSGTHLHPDAASCPTAAPGASSTSGRP